MSEDLFPLLPSDEEAANQTKATQIEFRALGSLHFSLRLHHAARHIIVRAPGRPGRIARQRIPQNVQLGIYTLVRNLQES